MNHIYSADEGGLALFKIDVAMLHLQYANSSMIGKSQDVIVTAVSKDPANPNKTLTCTINMTAIFVDKEDMKLYATGF
jgi:hypothetical protein